MEEDALGSNVGGSTPEIEKFYGSVPLNLDFRVVRQPMVVDDVTGDATMDVKATIQTPMLLQTPRPELSEFTIDRTVSVDATLIDEASKKAFPDSASELLPKIVGALIDEQKSAIAEIIDQRDTELLKTSRFRTRRGMFTGAVFGITGAMSVWNCLEGNYGMSVIFGIGTLGIIALGESDARNSYEEKIVAYEWDTLLDDARDEYFQLRLMESAVKNRTVMDRNVNYTTVLEVSNL